MEEATTYTTKSVDCPYCGNVNELEDASQDYDGKICRCKACGEEFRIYD